MHAFIHVRDSALVHLGGSRDRAASTLDRGNGSNWIAARALPDPQAIMTVALVSFMAKLSAEFPAVDCRGSLLDHGQEPPPR